MGNERTRSGSPILRHKAGDQTFKPASGGGGEALSTLVPHMEKHFGPVKSVSHELASHLVHVDIHIIPPSAERDHYVLFTTGMSDRAMTIPRDCADMARVELMLSLPSNWRLDDVSIRQYEKWSWPLKWMRMLARLPHEHNSWLGFGHTIPNGDPPRPFASGTKLCCWMLLPSVQLEDAAWTVETPSKKQIAVYALHALHRAEMTLKLDEGLDPLLEAWSAAGVTEVLEPGRKSAV